MKVLHFILGKASKDRANGVNQVVAGMAKYAVLHGVDVRVIGKAESTNFEGEIINRDNFTVEIYTKWSKKLISALNEAIVWADVVHLHGTYSPHNIIVGRMCENARRPYFLTLHNGLSPELAKSSGWFKKKAFHIFFQKKHLANADAIHVLSEEEATEVLSVIKPKSIFCIPNGVDLDDYSNFEKKSFNSIKQIKIGYLGRLSPEKNLDAFCSAFARLNKDGNLLLELAGPKSRYGLELQKRYSAYGVKLVGPKYGTDKDDFIHNVDLFVVPSLAEGFSIAVAESLALGTPLLVTRTSKVSYLYNNKTFFMCEPTEFGLERGLRRALENQEEWEERTIQGRQLIDAKLNWSVIAKDLINAYELVIESR